MIKDEFDTSGQYIWLCPNVPNITVNNNPFLYDYGKGRNFVMVVNLCSTAKKVEQENGLKSYSDI